MSQLRSLLIAGCAGLSCAFGTLTIAQPVDLASVNAAAKPDRTLVVIYADSLKSAAEEWAKYRQSDAGGNWRVVFHPAGNSEDQAAQRTALRSFIVAAHRESGATDASRFAVLLLGDAEADQRSDPAATSRPAAATQPQPAPSGIATWHFKQKDAEMRSSDADDYATDQPYQLIDNRDDIPDIQLGRVPARTPQEADAVLGKIKRYEATPVGASGRNRITYVAGEGHFGVMDDLLESLFKTMVDRMVPPAFELSMTYAKASSVYCPPPSKLSDAVLERMSEGAVLFNYIGHGFEKGLDSLRWGQKRFPILRSSDLKRLPENPSTSAQMPIAFMSCCSVGHFDLPKGARCFSEEMLFHPSGPVAVISGSRITHPYANTVMQMDITRALLVDRAPTVGMLDLIAARSSVRIDEFDRELDAIALPISIAGKWQTDLMGLRRMHTRLYNLLGDPATAVRLPAQAIADLKYENGRITGRVEGMKKGRVVVTVETERVSFAHADGIIAVDGDNDADLERKAANNYPLSNDRLLGRYEGAVVDGRFEVMMQAKLPASARCLRIYAVADEQESQMDAVAALMIATPAPDKSELQPGHAP